MILLGLWKWAHHLVHVLFTVSGVPHHSSDECPQRNVFRHATDALYDTWSRQVKFFFSFSYSSVHSDLQSR